MEIKQLKLENLVPYINNPRKEQAVDKVASSIKEFGWQQPIVVDENNVIIVGHTRYQAAKKLNLKTVPVQIAKGLTDAQTKAYRLADNKLNENALWDLDMLSFEIDGLKEIGFTDFENLGFSTDDLDDILINGEEAEFPEISAGDKEPFQQITFTLHDSQAKIVKDAVARAIKSLDKDLSVNANANGNAIAKICEHFNGIS